ncbi:hypothetical protein [Mycolicibacterium stellerae]|uniref:hypothetical protein n=1 Tax=Mycolicibacterium stellerae TaxID=2358193 RepID=UPI0013DDAB1B|nr:hypothetical protein [Mycolicibacterium stellerae]
MLVFDVFAGLLVAGGTARFGNRDPGRAAAQYEAANEHACTRGDAQTRHLHRLPISDKVADQAFIVRELSHTSCHRPMESLLAEETL